MFFISNFDLSGTSRRCLRRSFRPPFSKGSADPTRGALVASSEAKFLYPSKAPPKGECRARLGRGEDRLRWVCFACEAGNRTSGGFTLYNKAKTNLMSAFFFDTRGTKKKAWQKRNAAKGVSPLRRRPTLRALDRRRLLKKAGENFYADIAVKSPTNQNLKIAFTNPTGRFLAISMALSKSSRGIISLTMGESSTVPSAI